MSNRFIKSFSSTFSSINGKVVKNEEEIFHINNDSGEYKKKKFGKVIEKKKLNKKDIDTYILKHKPGFYIPDNIFNTAVNILNEWSNFIDDKQDIPVVQPALRDKKKKYKKTKIDNSIKQKKRNKKCFEIEDKYPELKGKKNKKRLMKKIYRKKALKYHPDKCAEKECKAQFQEINNDYNDYINDEYAC